MLTDAAVRRVKPRDKAFKTQDMHGMYLLVQPGGDSVLAVGFRHDGKPGTVALGVYPNVYRKDRANARKIAYLALRGRLPASWNSSDAGDQT